MASYLWPICAFTILLTSLPFLCDNVHSEDSFYSKHCKYLFFSLQAVALSGSHLSSSSSLSLDDSHGDQRKCWHFSQLGEFVRDSSSLHFKLGSRLDRQNNIPNSACLWCSRLRLILNPRWPQFHGCGVFGAPLKS